jgi:hypothetical protein
VIGRGENGSSAAEGVTLNRRCCRSGSVRDILAVIMIRPVPTIVCYARADESYRAALEKHLAPLVRTGAIQLWHDRMLAPGMDWRQQIDRQLDDAELIILLVSADFLHSDYCYDTELTRSTASSWMPRSPISKR